MEEGSIQDKPSGHEETILVFLGRQLVKAEDPVPIHSPIPSNLRFETRSVGSSLPFHCQEEPLTSESDSSQVSPNWWFDAGWDFSQLLSKANGKPTLQSTRLQASPETGEAEWVFFLVSFFFVWGGGVFHVPFP